MVKHLPFGCTSTCLESRKSPASVLLSLRSAFSFGLASSWLILLIKMYIATLLSFQYDMSAPSVGISSLEITNPEGKAGAF